MTHNVRRWKFVALLAALLPLVWACGKRELPMTRDQIFDERMKVDTLYITEGGREFIGEGNKVGVTVDPQTNELAWAAWKCGNPDCPGEGKEGRPFTFIWPNFLAYVKEDGTVGFNQPRSPEDMKKFEKFAEPGCPACAEIRNRAKETEEQRLQYQNWAQRYVLPEAEARLKELDVEWQKYLEREEQRQQQAGR